MKKIIAFFLFIISFAFTGCKSSQDEPGPITLDSNTYNVAYNANFETISITTSSTWSASSDQSWCTPISTSGSGNKTVCFRINGNTTTSARTANITFKSGSISATTTVTQAAMSDTKYQYKLPIIFHVLYNNASSTTQYVNQGWMAQVVSQINTLYNNNGMNLQFEMAAYDPNGNALSEPGVDREKINVSSIDCEKFMQGEDSNNSTYTNMLWNLHYYINVFLYPFSSDESDYITLGITHMPYISSNSPSVISDLYENNTAATTYYSSHSFNYPHCSSIDSNYIYQTSTSTSYNPLNVIVTIAHELGHYLGLYHPFTETGETTCSGTDYCDDTPNYDRTTYETWLDANYKTATTLAQLATRTNCSDGSTFVAHNIMDYEYCYSDKFTNDQATRVFNVLNYGLFMPGPKNSSVSTSSLQTLRSSNNQTQPTTILYKSFKIKNGTFNSNQAFKIKK